MTEARSEATTLLTLPRCETHKQRDQQLMVIAMYPQARLPGSQVDSPASSTVQRSTVQGPAGDGTRLKRFLTTSSVDA